MRKINFLKSTLALMACLFMSTSVQASITVLVKDPGYTPYLWAWQDGNVNVFSAWPGQQLTESVEVGNNKYYYYTFDSAITKVHLLFSDNGNNQTYDWGNIENSIVFQIGDKSGDKYTMSTIMPAVSLTPEPGVYKSGVTVGFDVSASPLPVDYIYYTTDGEEPTTASVKTTTDQTLSIEDRTAVKAFAETNIVAGAETVSLYSSVVGGVYSTEAERITIYMKNVSNWEKVYFYAWNPENVSEHYLGDWPGMEITRTIDVNDDEPDGIFYCHTFDASVHNVNIIFNNGSGSQTGDLKGIVESTAFDSNGTILENAIPSAIESTRVEGAEVVVYPNPVAEVLNVESAAAVSEILVYNVGGALVAEGAGATLNVEALPAGCYIYRVTLADGGVSNGRFIKR